MGFNIKNNESLNQKNIEQPNNIVLFSGRSWEDIEAKLHNGLLSFFKDYEITGVENIPSRKNFAQLVIQDIRDNNRLNARNISPLNLKGFEVKNGYLIMYDTLGREFLYTFNLNKNAYFIPRKLDEIISEKREIISGKIDAFSESLDVLEYLFTQNENEWFGFLNEDGTINDQKVNNIGFSKKYSGRTILEVQAIARQEFRELVLARYGIVGSDGIDEKIYPLERRYMTMILGIGDKYEGGAKIFQKDTLEVEYLISEQINARPNIESLFAFLREEHLKIDDNNHQSDAVKESYQVYTKALHEGVLNRLIDEFRLAEEDPSKQNILEGHVKEFVEIITGRNGNDIDRELTDPLTANKAIMLLFTRTGGIIEKFRNNPELGKIQIEDDSYVKGRSPKKIIDEFVTLASKSIMGVSRADLLTILEIDSLKDSTQSYQDLDFIGKGKISLVARLIEKLRPGTSAIVIGESVDIQTHTNSYTLQELVTFIAEIEEDVSWDIVSQVGESFEGNWSDWGGLDRDKLEQYKNADGTQLFDSFTLDNIDLFRDINGYGWLNPSDTSQYVSGEIGKGAAVIVGGAIIGFVALAALPAIATVGGGAIAVVSGGAYAGGALAGSMIGTVASGNIVVQGAIFGMSASMTSWVTHPKGYDSLSEASMDLSTDVILGGSTGAAGGLLAKRFGIEGARLLSLDTVKNFSRVNVPDIAILGFGSEGVRQTLVAQIFQEQIIKEGQELLSPKRTLPSELEPGSIPIEDGNGNEPLITSQK